MQNYDALIIGGGQAGSPLAQKLAQKGWQVALIEREYLGGTCINYGCTPTKTMVASASVAQYVRRAGEFGIHVDPFQVDLPAIVERKNKIVQSWRHGQEERVKAEPNIRLIYGEATFSGPYTVKVNDEELHAEKIFINTGASAAVLPITGIQEVPYLTNRSILDLTVLPEHLLILGASYVGLEFGQMFQRFGSQVTVIEKNSQIVPREDEDVAASLREALENEGMEFLLEVETTRVDQLKSGKIRVTIKDLNGGSELQITGSHLLLATGRVPNTAALNPEQAGIETKRGWIPVNEYLETNVPGIYALGDVNGGPAFTHISYDDFLIVYNNLFNPQKRSTHDRQVPYCLYTDPELGRVGLTERQAAAAGIKYRVGKIPMSYVARAIERGQTAGLMKIIIDTETNQIIGAAILGVDGGELVHSLMALMLAKAPWTTFYKSIFIHPTLSEGFFALFDQLGEGG